MAASRSAHQDEPFHRTKIKKRNESIYAVREDTTGKRIGTACAVKKITETTKEYCLLSWNKIGQNGAQEMIADRYSHTFSKHNAKHSVKIAKPAEEDGLSYFQLNCRPDNCLNLVEHNLSKQELKVVKAGFSVYTFMERGVIQLDFKLNCGKYDLIKIQPEQSGFDEKYAIGAPIIIGQGRGRKDTVIGVLGMSASGNLIPIFHRDAGVDFEEERPVENIREQSANPKQKECPSNEEKYMNKKPHLVEGTFLDGASVVKSAVGKIRLGGDRVMATGFRISKGLIMTCQHIGNVTPEDVIQFNYAEPPLPGTPASAVTKASTETFFLRPDILYYRNAKLDFAVVAISYASESPRSTENVEAISSVHEIKEKKQLANLQLSIFSHPEGKTLKGSLLQEAVVEDPSKQFLVGKEKRAVSKEIILHKAETEVGSSGAPIFDEHWRLVGIHQGYEEVLVQSPEDESTEEVFCANYGTLMKYILDEMFSKPGEEPTEFETKFNSCEEDLGIPFKEYSKKLKDSSHSASASPASAIPPHSPDETGINSKERVPSSGLFREIRGEYQRQSKRLQVFPWCNTKQPLTDSIYTKLKILVRSNETGQLTSEIVNMNEIFKPHEECASPQLVLIGGDPGMGKTTFCRKLTLDWSREKIEAPFPQFQVVLLLTCRDFKTADIRKAIIDQLLPRSASKEKTEAFFRELHNIQSDVLLILDGLDELKGSVAAEDLVDPRKRNILPNSYVLVTSRHNAEVRGLCDTFLESVGFTRGDAEEYIRKYFKEEREKAENLLEKIGLREVDDDFSGVGPEKIAIQELITNPLNTALICAVFEDNGDLPSARTKLYDKFVHCILKRFYIKQGQIPPKQPIDACKKELREIGRLALKGIQEDKLSFEESELESCSENIISMGFLSREESAGKVDPKSLLYFMHKTFQEYLAALYLSHQLINGEVTIQDFIQEFSIQEQKFTGMLGFIAGILAGNGATAQLVLFVKLLSRCLSTMYEAPVIGFCADSKDEYVQWMAQYSFRAYNVSFSFVLLCDCVDECGNGQQLNKLQKELCSIIGRNISWKEVSPFYFCLKRLSVLYQVLCEVLKHNKTIEYLSLSFCKISDCSLLADSLRRNRTLRVLSLSHNYISGNDILFETLMQNRTLLSLCLCNNNISESESLAKLLKQNRTLKALDLRENNISDCRVLAESLKQNRTLKELRLSTDSISDMTPLEEVKLHSTYLNLVFNDLL